MNTSTFLARLMGPIGIAIGLGLLLNPRTYRRMAEEFLQTHALIYFSGLVAGGAGLAVVLTHNVWVIGWPVVITILGWLALLGGLSRIVAPQLAERIGTFMFARRINVPIIGAGFLLVGGWLSFAGYSR